MNAGEQLWVAIPDLRPRFFGEAVSSFRHAGFRRGLDTTARGRAMGMMNEPVPSRTAEGASATGPAFAGSSWSQRIAWRTARAMETVRWLAAEFGEEPAFDFDYWNFKELAEPVSAGKAVGPPRARRYHSAVGPRQRLAACVGQLVRTMPRDENKAGRSLGPAPRPNRSCCPRRAAGNDRPSCSLLAGGCAWISCPSCRSPPERIIQPSGTGRASLPARWRNELRIARAPNIGVCNE